MEAAFVRRSIDDDFMSNQDDAIKMKTQREKRAPTMENRSVAKLNVTTTEVLDRMTAIECRAGQVENSEGMDLLLHTARERRMMRKKRKLSADVHQEARSSIPRTKRSK
jgi:hypothetical protein